MHRHQLHRYRGAKPPPQHGGQLKKPGSASSTDALTERDDLVEPEVVGVGCLESLHMHAAAVFQRRQAMEADERVATLGHVDHPTHIRQRKAVAGPREVRLLRRSNQSPLQGGHALGVEPAVTQLRPLDLAEQIGGPIHIAQMIEQHCSTSIFASPHGAARRPLTHSPTACCASTARRRWHAICCATLTRSGSSWPKPAAPGCVSSDRSPCIQVIGRELSDT